MIIWSGIVLTSFASLDFLPFCEEEEEKTALDH
jgi:hypothetical protein